MSNIIPFQFDTHAIRAVVDEQGEPWFIAKEIAEALGYSDAFEMSKKLDDDEKQNRQIAGFGPRGVTLINEAGLYACILTSQKAEAKRFKRWVTHDVLPAIRKTGNYTMPQPAKPAQDNGLAQFRKARALDMATRTAERICAQFPSLGEPAKQVIFAKIINPIAHTEIISLPALTAHYYSAAEVGERFGITAAMVGRIANKHNLKTDEYGEHFLDKSPYSAKEVEAFRYNERGATKIGELAAAAVATAAVMDKAQPSESGSRQLFD